MRTTKLFGVKNRNCHAGLVCFLTISCLQNLGAQCTIPVVEPSGTVPVGGCTEVTITSTGSAGAVPFLCNTGPYLIGLIGSGSYQFDFNPPVSGAIVNVFALNNNAVGVEEMVFYVDGNFFPITTPGVTATCFVDAEIYPPGVIRACDGCISSWDSIRINTQISSLIVEDNFISGNPTGITFSLLICCPVCPTDAGILSGNSEIFCADGVANFAPPAQTYLDNNDVLQYILFSNPNDTLGSIIATNNSPSFGFNPATMLTGITYFAAAIAGNNAGGNVDLNDGCLDVSNALEFTWQPSPTVQFTISDPNVCDGACSTVNVALTGTPPFQLSVADPFNGNATYTFGANTGTFQVCPPTGTPPGNIQITALSVSDAFCTCE